MVAAAKHECDVNFTKKVIAVLHRRSAGELRAFEADFVTYFIGAGLHARTDLPEFNELAACVAYVEAVGAVLSATKAATAASSSCAMSPTTLSLSGSGRTTRLRAFTMGGASALQTGCTASSGQLAISVAPRSKGTPLGRVVGSNLGLGIVRSPKNPAGGQLSVAFNESSSTSGPPATTGSWVNKQAPTAGPPWQLSASNGQQTLDATWTGGAGHTGLRGSFHGSLAQPNGTDAYAGTFNVTEAGTTVTGATFTIDHANQIEIDLQPTGRPPIHYTFVRTG